MNSILRTLRRPCRELLRTFVDFVLPPVCPACGDAANGLCTPCDQALQRRPARGCPRCGEPVLVRGQSCGDDHRALRHLARHAAPFYFAGTGGALVRRFKLDGDAGAGRRLAVAMARALAPSLGGPWRHALLIPVPLHASRRRERGFDQAEWLAREVGRRVSLEVASGVLRRSRATLPQGDPRVTSRAENVAGAFVVARAQRVAGRRCILVDDVFTSGATARSCADLLLAAQALEVAVLTACRS
ncbi:MAG: ComF family protein [Planctomycetes bacterium]|nr:ComF family protein [Planctomycetota bacterium]